MQTKWIVAVGVSIAFTLAARADEAIKGLSDPQIEAVNRVLIPGAQNAQVKRALQNTVPTLEGHLQHARNVQAQLPAKTASR
ncbi:MAG TPA: hypothetical protein VN177_09105 [Myxococcales bacterium]|nr:hypothetical protein [Myxococcales bacterium]